MNSLRESPPEVKAAHMHYQRLLTHSRDLVRSYIDVGQDVTTVMEQESWKHLGWNKPQDFFEASIEQGGVNMPMNSALEAARVYRKFIRELRQDRQELVDIGPKKLRSLAAHCNEETVDDLLGRAKMMSHPDLVQSLRENPPAKAPDPLDVKPAAPPVVSEPIKMWPAAQAPPEYKAHYEGEVNENSWIALVPKYLAESKARILVAGGFRLSGLKFSYDSTTVLEDQAALYLGE